MTPENEVTFFSFLDWFESFLEACGGDNYPEIHRKRKNSSLNHLQTRRFLSRTLAMYPSPNLGATDVLHSQYHAE